MKERTGMYEKLIKDVLTCVKLSLANETEFFVYSSLIINNKP